MCGWGGGTPAAETDATVVWLNFLCQAPPSTGQKQTQMLVASVCACMCVCLCVCVNKKKEHCLIQYRALPGAHTSTAVIVYCSILVHLPLFSERLSQSYLRFPPSIFLTLSSLSFSPSPSLRHLSLCSNTGSHCSKKGKQL